MYLVIFIKYREDVIPGLKAKYDPKTIPQH